jgi:hypothetical protein
MSETKNLEQLSDAKTQSVKCKLEELDLYEQELYKIYVDGAISPNAYALLAAEISEKKVICCGGKPNFPADY